MSYLLNAVPVLAVDDLDQAIAFYQHRLGFDLVWTWGEPATVAAVVRDDVEVNLARRGVNGSRGASSVYLRLTDVDEFYAECERRGASPAGPPEDQPYGMREFSLIDSSGNKLSFGEAVVE